MLERQIVLRKGAHDIEKKTAWQDDNAIVRVGHGGAHLDSEIHVGGLKLKRITVDFELDPSERLNRAAGGRATHDHRKMAKERFT